MKALANYLHNREVAIQGLLKKPRHKYSAKTFHQLRVEIKKLNALLDLIAFCSEGFDREKKIKPFKQIFRQAGKVREIQIEEAMLKKILPKNSLKQYRKGLKKRRLKAQKAFFKLANKKLAIRLIKALQKIKPFLSEVTKTEAIGYLEKIKTGNKNLLCQRSLKTEQVHELRRQVKILNYTRLSLHPKKKYENEVVLSELLGKWHDCQVIISHLQKMFSNKKIEPEERSQLEKVKAKLAAKSDNLFDKINKALASSEVLETLSSTKDQKSILTVTS